MKKTFLFIVFLSSVFLMNLNAQNFNVENPELRIQDESMPIASEPNQQQKSVKNLSGQIPFQGRLLENNEPVSGMVSISFSFEDLSWTETHTNVNVIDGLYSVVLGSIEPLPANLFYEENSRQLQISVNGTVLTPVDVFPSFTSNRFANELHIESEPGTTKALLHVEQNNHFGQLELFNADGFPNAMLGSIGDGHEGFFRLFDSLQSPNVTLRARNKNLGGLLTLFHSNEDETPGSILHLAAQNNISFLQLWAQNQAADGRSIMINHYNTIGEIGGGPAMPNNYRRSGTDWLDNQGRVLAAIGNTMYSGGDDPEGASGYFSLWGTNSFNVELTGKRWENNDLPIFQLFGSQKDENNNTARHVTIEVSKDGDNEWGNMVLFGNHGNPNIILGSKHWETGGANRGYFSIMGNQIWQTIFSAEVVPAGNGDEYAQIFLHSTTGEQLQITPYIAYFGTQHSGGNGVSIYSNGNIMASGTITANTVVENSDLSLKTNIHNIENALNKTLHLRGVHFEWKNNQESENIQIGLIAQEVEEVLPELVVDTDNGTKAVNYSQMVAVLIEAIKELNQKIENLEQQNHLLQSQLSQQNDLVNEVNTLKILMKEILSNENMSKAQQNSSNETQK